MDTPDSHQPPPPGLVVTSTVTPSINLPHHTALPIHPYAMYPPPSFYYLPVDPATGSYIAPFYVPVPAHPPIALPVQQGVEPVTHPQYYHTTFVPITYPQPPNNLDTLEYQQHIHHSYPLLQSTAPSPEHIADSGSDDEMIALAID